jgi:hypothetical protein
VVRAISDELARVADCIAKDKAIDMGPINMHFAEFDEALEVVFKSIFERK